MPSQNVTIRCKNCVRLPLLSGPLSILICSRRHGDLLGLVQRCPPGLKRINDEIARLERTPKGDAQLRTVFLHDPTGNIFLVQAQVVITRPVIAPREATAETSPIATVALQSILKRLMCGEAVASWSFFQYWQK